MGILSTAITSLTFHHVGSPRTKASTAAFREADRKKSATNVSTDSKIRRLSNLEVSDFILAKNVTSVEQLFAKADDRKQEGNFDLANFLFSRTQKSIQELIVKSWMRKNASSEIQRDEITRIQKVRNAAAEACVDGCNGSWLECA